uniref:Uncharacterized protein n=1 Tax=Romanomermis culicivorax TaxID=13658 RepID=A0A915JID0_ROMCU
MEGVEKQDKINKATTKEETTKKTRNQYKMIVCHQGDYPNCRWKKFGTTNDASHSFDYYDQKTHQNSLINGFQEKYSSDFKTR